MNESDLKEVCLILLRDYQVTLQFLEMEVRKHLDIYKKQLESRYPVISLFSSFSTFVQIRFGGREGGTPREEKVTPGGNGFSHGR